MSKLSKIGLSESMSLYLMIFITLYRRDNMKKSILVAISGGVFALFLTPIASAGIATTNSMANSCNVQSASMSILGNGTQNIVAITTTNAETAPDQVVTRLTAEPLAQGVGLQPSYTVNDKGFAADNGQVTGGTIAFATNPIAVAFATKSVI